MKNPDPRPVEHAARHVKAVARAAAKSGDDRPHLMQLRVTERLLEATDGRWLLRVETSPQGDGYSGTAGAAAARDVCRAGGVDLVRFGADVLTGLGEDENGDERAVVYAPLAGEQGFLPLDATNKLILGNESRISVSVDAKLLSEALRALAEAGARSVELSLGGAMSARVIALVMPCRPKPDEGTEDEGPATPRTEALPGVDATADALGIGGPGSKA